MTWISDEVGGNFTKTSTAVSYCWDRAIQNIFCGFCGKLSGFSHFINLPIQQYLNNIPLSTN